MILTNRSTFCDQFDLRLEDLGKNICSVLREDPIWLNPTFQVEFGDSFVYMKRISLKKMLIYALISHYIPEREFRGLLQSILWEQARRLFFEDRVILFELLKGNKNYNRLLVLETSIFGITANEFFGILGNISFNDLKLHIFRVKQRKPKYSARKRGYHDHGTLRPQHKSHRNEPDFELNQIQEAIDRRKRFYEVDFPKIIKGCIT